MVTMLRRAFSIDYAVDRYQLLEQAITLVFIHIRH
jgi:hypothetical protein